jgi:hypothetical protein
VRASGRSILFIGHNIHHVFDIADRLVALEARRAQFGSAEELIGFYGARRGPGWAARAEVSGAMGEGAEPRPAEDWSHPHDRPLRRLVVNTRAPLGSFAVFVVMMAIFLIANPLLR